MIPHELTSAGPSTSPAPPPAPRRHRVSASATPASPPSPQPQPEQAPQPAPAWRVGSTEINDDQLVDLPAGAVPLGVRMVRDTPTLTYTAPAEAPMQYHLHTWISAVSAVVPENHVIVGTVNRPGATHARFFQDREHKLMTLCIGPAVRPSKTEDYDVWGGL